MLFRSHDRLGARSGVGFAVPIARLQAVLPQLRSGRDLRAGRIGVRANQISTDQPGVELIWVDAQGPGFMAGLRAGDRVMSLAGQPTACFADFVTVTADLFAGQTVTVAYVRSKRRYQSQISLEGLKR